MCSVCDMEKSERVAFKRRSRARVVHLISTWAAIYVVNYYVLLSMPSSAVVLMNFSMPCI